MLVSFSREQFSAPSSTSNISISCSAFPQTHIHAALFTTTQPNLKCESKAHPAIVSIQNAFCDPNVGVVHMEEMRFPNKDVKTEAKFEKHRAFCSVLHQHLPRAPLHQKNGCLWENNFSFWPRRSPALAQYNHKQGRFISCSVLAHLVLKSLHLCICIKSLHYLIENPECTHATAACRPTMNL